VNSCWKNLSITKVQDAEKGEQTAQGGENAWDAVVIGFYNHGMVVGFSVNYYKIPITLIIEFERSHLFRLNSKYPT
jgi:hypothetical protein